MIDIDECYDRITPFCMIDRTKYIDFIRMFHDIRDVLDYNTCGYIVTKDAVLNRNIKKFTNGNIAFGGYNNIDFTCQTLKQGTSEHYIEIIGLVILDTNKNIIHLPYTPLLMNLYKTFGNIINIGSILFFLDYNYDRFTNTLILYNKEDISHKNLQIPFDLMSFFSSQKPDISLYSDNISQTFRDFIHKYEEIILIDYNIYHECDIEYKPKNS